MTGDDRLSRLPPLGETIRQHRLSARKGLGQHFLLDLNLTGRIARAAGDLTQGTTIEIGPGPGGLTRALLMAGAARVVAVERDVRAVAALAELAEAAEGRLVVVEADAQTIDPTALGPPPRRIVANLPYNVGTPLLIAWLRRMADFESLTLMFQKEVAERLAAGPGEPAYGRLSVLVRATAEARRLFDVAPSAFTPPPKVVSSVVRLTPRTDPFDDVEAIEQVTAAAFGQRRKMLRQSLKSLGVSVEPLLAAAGIDPTARAETLDVAEFAGLTRELKRLRAAG